MHLKTRRSTTWDSTTWNSNTRDRTIRRSNSCDTNAPVGITRYGDEGAAMAPDSLMARAVALGASVDALAALAAFVRIETEGLPADAAVRQLLAEIAAELLSPGVDDGTLQLNAAAAVPAVGLVRTFLRQAAELVENPGRTGGWDQVDVPLLHSIGRLSMAVVDSFLAAERDIPELGERLTSPGARFLDVGTGVGWLAITAARAHPELAVTGIDLFEPALALARTNVADQGLGDRVTLRLQDATTLDDPDTYDAIWLPLPFLPVGIVPAVAGAAARALKPGGWILAGTFTGPPDRLSQLLNDLRTVRSGGHPWRPDELIAMLADTAGLTGAREIARTWAAPVRLYVAQRS